MTKNDPTKLIYVGIIRSKSQEGRNCGQSLGLLKILLLKSLVKVLAWMLLEYCQRMVACWFILDDLKSHDLLKEAITFGGVILATKAT